MLASCSAFSQVCIVLYCFVLSLWLIGTVRTEPETVISNHLTGSIPRPGRINCLKITGAHALRLISRTGKRV